MSATNKKNVLYKNRFAIFFFAYAVVYAVAAVNRFVPWEVDDTAIYSFYAVDYSFGFATKLLPGAIFRFLFRDHADRETATAFMTAVVLVCFALLAVLLQRFMSRMPEKRRSSAFLLVLFFLSGAYSFAIFTKTLGLMDTFWLLFALLFFFFLEHSVLRLLIPLLFALSVLVHNAALICYIPLMSIVLLFRASVEEDRRRRAGFFVVLALSLAGAAALFVFVSARETELIVPIDEFHEKLLENGSDSFYYFDYALFGNYLGNQYIPEGALDGLSPAMRLIMSAYYRVKLNIGVLFSRGAIHPLSFLCGLAVLSPVAVLFGRFHLCRFRASGGFLRSFCAWAMTLLFPVIVVVAIPFSEDITRWYSHAFIVAFTCVLAVLYYSETDRELFFGLLEPYAGSAWLKIYCIAYATLSMYTIY
ncbi:MAG: hypothetical protein K6C36_04540 [Clostridia bacterium]|nr:hypothetical protein [Clostridia bacterium]